MKPVCAEFKDNPEDRQPKIQEPAMAKMFYSLDEAAETLGITPDQVKALAEQGKLQQFRDRDKVMFKRDHVEKLKSDGGAGAGGGDDLELAPTKKQDGDALDLKSETDKDSRKASKDKKSATATGISVFDAGEVELDDPMAQTQVTSSLKLNEESFSLESVGSGSGLLDLTRETDDASMGAMELLDDINPTGGGTDAAGELSSLTRTGTGVFDSVAGINDGTPSGLDNLSRGAGMGAGAAAYYAEPSDPAGEGFGVGVLLGVCAPVVIGLLLVASSLSGLTMELGQKYAQNMPGWGFGMFFGSMILGLIGYFIGRSRR